MRRLIAIVCLLVAAPALAQAISPGRVISVRSAAELSGSCSGAVWAIEQTTNAMYKCSGGVFVRDDVASCGASAPSGACTGKSLCIYESALYGCVAGAYAQIGGGANPAGSDGDVQGKSGDDLVASVEQDLDGDGAQLADWNGDSTVDEAGLTVGTLKATRLLGPTVNGTTGATHVSAIAAAYAHASQYGDPRYYTAPAVCDTYVRVFRGQPLNVDYDGSAGASDTEESSSNVSRCYANNCSTQVANFCVDGRDTNSDGTVDAVDPDSDGTAEIVVGTVVYVGSTTGTLRTHVVKTVAVGTDAATNCPTTSMNLTVSPYIQQTEEGVAAGAKLTPVWESAVHLTRGADYLVGWLLANASREQDGSHGRSLLLNGEGQHDATMRGWVASSGSFTAKQVTVPPGVSNVNQCLNGLSACAFGNDSTTGSTTITSSDWITVQPGEELLLRGLMLASEETIGVYIDAAEDGTLEALESKTLNDAWYQREMLGYPSHFHMRVPVSYDSGRVKVRITKKASSPSASYPGIDDWGLHRATEYVGDDAWSTTRHNYLIQDPGARMIVLAGDSWMNPAGHGADILAGFLAGMQTRLGRDLSAQVVATGISGEKSEHMASATTCTLPGAGSSYLSGSYDCFYAQVARHEPLYVVYSLGINDCITGVTEADFLSHLRTIVRRTREIGAIPIFLSVPPAIADENADGKIVLADDAQLSSAWKRCHDFSFSARNMLLNMVP